MDIKPYIREIPDFPKKGINYKDITTLLKKPTVFSYVVDKLANRYFDKNIKKIIGIESRGFIFGSALAYKINAGFIPIRKPGKLPSNVINESYTLEYGNDKLEIHEDAIIQGEKVILIDDLIATGGTIIAAIKLLKKLRADIHEIAFLIELAELEGTKRIKALNIDYYSLSIY